MAGESSPTPGQAPSALIQDLLDGFAHGAVLFDRDQRLVAFNRAYACMNPAISAGLRQGMSFRECLEVAVRDGGGITDPARIEAWIAHRLRQRGDGEGLAQIRTPTGIIATVQEQRRCRMAGHAPGEVAGRTPGSVPRGPDTDPVVDAAMRDAIRAGSGFKVEILNCTKLRETYWCAIDCVPIRNGAGDVERFIAVELDVMQRRAQQTALEDTLAQTNAVMAQQRAFVSIAAP